MNTVVFISNVVSVCHAVIVDDMCIAIIAVNVIADTAMCKGFYLKK